MEKIFVKLLDIIVVEWVRIGIVCLLLGICFLFIFKYFVNNC